MKIGIPKELKDKEFRVGMTPGGAHTLVDAGHEVFLEKSAGEGSGFEDQEYSDVGVQVLPDADAVWGHCDMIVKVKEPIEPEYHRMREGQILYTYLHLAPLPRLTEVMCERKVSGIAYETITDDHGGLPLLAPMSEVAGRMSVLVGATHLQKAHGGRGVLVTGVPGVTPGDVVIIGGGIVGLNALKIALGLRARVLLMDNNPERMREIDDLFEGSVTTVMSNRHNIEASIAMADIVIGAVLIPGRSAPKLVTRENLKLMKKGSVLVDVAVDQGGCFETTRPTTHSDPVYEVDGIVHYCVANMPGAVPRTSTLALTNSTLPFALKIANHGFEKAVRDDAHLRAGVNTHGGHITCQPVSESQNRPFVDVMDLI
ncbi:MAG: alanine dehydrogenase [Acidobacteriota bacterium]